MAVLDRRTQVDFADLGFSAFSFEYAPAPREKGRFRNWHPGLSGWDSHTHLEVEMFLTERGGVVLDFGGRVHAVGPSAPVLFWAGLPHRILELEKDTVFHAAHVPIVNVLSWPTPSRLLGRVLGGQVLQDVTAGDVALVDRVLFARWTRDLSGEVADCHRAAELEIEARMRRFLSRVGDAPDSIERPRPVVAARVEAATKFVASRFAEEISVDLIAAATGSHRDSLMASFRQMCGITLWEYVTRVRLAEAQRLLATTDLAILTICHQAGFSSTSRMYDAFKRYRTMTPAEFRRLAAR